MKVLKLLALGLLPVSPLFGAVVFTNADFSAEPPGSNWLIYVETGSPGGVQPVENYVTFDGPVATYTNPTGIGNFYQEFNAVLQPGVTYTFSAHIANANFPGTSPQSAGWLSVKEFTPGFGTRTQWDFVQIFESTNGIVSVTFTPQGDGNRIHQLGLVFNGRNQYNPSVEFSNPTVIPEPGTYALLFGIVGLAFVLYRRRR
ncbi:MAG: PEP-CTERM sorting domain-containing protein [Opitutales bacterium]|nr:PEP-CTERM sorting domain-containing protein [Opitutales bacterium]